MFAVIASVLGDSLSCLKDFYTQTNGPNWNVKTNWETEDPCSFYGITCEENVVQGLNLANNNVGGRIPLCIADMQLSSLVLSGNDFKQSSFPTQMISSLKTLKLDDCHLRATDGEFISPVQLSIRNNDFGLAVMKAGKESMYIDVTNTSVQGSVVIDDMEELIDISASSSNLKLIINEQIPYNLQSLDFSNTPTSFVMDDVMPILKAAENLRIVGLRRAQISGFQPNYDELQQFFVADVDENPMMCKHDSRSMGDCVFLIPRMIQNNVDNQLEIQFTTSKRLKSLTNDVFKHYTVYVKDYANSNTSTTSVTLLNKCSGSVLLDYLYTITCTAPYQINSIKDIAIAYKDKQVSNGALMIIKEINEMLEDVTNKGLNYFERTGQTKYEYKQEPLKNIHANQIRTQAVQPKMALQVTAYSKCPDYVSFVQQILDPFNTKFADIMKYIQYEYVSMAKADPTNVAKGTSMHGQLEAHMDLIYLCTQKLAKPLFKDTQICYNTKSEHCLGPTIPDPETIADIELCAIEQQGQDLLKQSQKFIKDNKVTWSPTILIDGKEICLWAYNIAEKDCDAKFQDADDFAKFVCGQPQMTGVAECSLI